MEITNETFQLILDKIDSLEKSVSDKIDALLLDNISIERKLKMTNDEISERLSECHAEFRELAVDYWGINKDNGKRAEIIALVEDLYKTKNLMKDYVAKRAETCYGLKALEKLEKENSDMKIAKINGNYQVTATLIAQLLTLAGVVLVALK